MTKDEFFGRRPQTREVTLDDGSKVYVRKLTQGEVKTMRKNYATDETAIEGLSYVVARTTVDENGVRIFADSDLAKLAEMDFALIQQIASEAVEFSGLNVSPKKG